MRALNRGNGQVVSQATLSYNQDQESLVTLDHTAGGMLGAPIRLQQSYEELINVCALISYEVHITCKNVTLYLLLSSTVLLMNTDNPTMGGVTCILGRHKKWSS